jgi:endonuclease/exonuclease/phosphatase family metal-dependent hydrolase
MQIRVMTYNIHGWRTAHGAPNLDAVAQVIVRGGADIIGLNEVFHPRPVGADADQPALAQLAERLGFHFVFGPCIRWPATDTLPASSYGNALLSRWPIIASAAHHLTPIEGIEDRGLLEGRILLPDGRTFTTYVTHLDYKSEANRLVQLRAVRSWTVRDRNRPHVLMGDFNAINPWDYEGRAEALDAVAQQPTVAHMALGVAGTGGSAGKGPQLIDAVQKAGYVDAFSRFGPRGETTFLLSPQPLRIDYIFVSTPLLPYLKDCCILPPSGPSPFDPSPADAEATDHASDHAPVLAHLEL